MYSGPPQQKQYTNLHQGAPTEKQNRLLNEAPLKLEPEDLNKWLSGEEHILTVLAEDSSLFLGTYIK